MFKNLRFMGSCAFAGAGCIAAYKLTGGDVLWSAFGGLMALAIAWVFLGKE